MSTDLQGMRSNPGLPMTAPMHYSSDMVLFTACDRVEAVVDGSRPGKNGRLFIVERNRPVKVPYEAGRFILEHLGYTGVVRVNEVETRDDEDNVIGIAYDVESAKDESLAKGIEQDQLRWQRFVSDMVTDYIKQSKPVPPPPDAILAIIERRGYKMQDYGIKPIGFQDPVDMERARLKSENAQLNDAVLKLQAQMELLIKQQSTAQQPVIVAQGVITDDDADVPSVPATGGTGAGRKSRNK